MAPPRISRKPGLGGLLVRGFAHADNLSNLQHNLRFRHEQAEIDLTDWTRPFADLDKRA